MKARIKEDMNNILSIREYADEVANEIKAQIPVNVVVSSAFKNNGNEYVGITFKVDDICPTMYINYDYNSGYSVKEAADRLVEQYRVYKKPDFGNLNQFLDFEKAKDYIFPNLVNLSFNQKAFDSKGVIYREWLDLCIIYRIVLPNITDGIASIKVTKSLLNGWGITEEELYEVAIKNLKPGASLRSLTSILASYMPMDCNNENDDDYDPLEMYVLSYKMPDSRGAACLLITELLEKHAKKAGSSFIIFPSSINEIVCCDKKVLDYSILKETVMSVNAEHVPPEAVLSENVYYYDFLDKQVKIYTEKTKLI